MAICGWEECENEIPRTGRRGRPPAYCSPDCKRLAQNARVRRPAPPLEPLEEELEEAPIQRPECIGSSCKRPVVIRGDSYCALCMARKMRRKK